MSYFGGGQSLSTDPPSSANASPSHPRLGTKLDFDAADERSGSAGNSTSMPLDLAGDPEKEMAILQKLKELQQHEAQMGEESEQGKEELANVEGELEQKETLLEQLKQTLEGYHGMRARYEKLLKEVEALENQKVRMEALCSGGHLNGWLCACGLNICLLAVFHYRRSCKSN